MWSIISTLPQAFLPAKLPSPEKWSHPVVISTASSCFINARGDSVVLLELAEMAKGRVSACLFAYQLSRQEWAMKWLWRSRGCLIQLLVSLRKHSVQPAGCFLQVKIVFCFFFLSFFLKLKTLMFWSVLFFNFS